MNFAGFKSKTAPMLQKFSVNTLGNSTILYML